MSEDTSSQASFVLLHRHKHVVTVEFITKVKFNSSSAEGLCQEFLGSSEITQPLLTNKVKPDAASVTNSLSLLILPATERASTILNN